MKSKTTLSRRTLLRGTACGVGAAMGLPLLEMMLDSHGTALAQGAPLPKRFVEWYWGNGVVADRWFPAGDGPSWELSPLLQPLAGVKDYLSIVQGTVVYVPYQVTGHFGSLMAITSGTLGTEQGGLNYAYANHTMDQAIAERIGAATRFRSLHFGVASTDTSDADFGVVHKAISHNGPNSPNLPVFDPIAMYERLFGDGFSEPGNLAAVTIANRRSVLDIVAGDARRLQSRLGARDKQRLEQHLQGVSELERQLTSMPVMPGCPIPSRPASSYPAIDAEQIHWEPLTAVQTELAVFALACDQTRVLTFRFSPANDYTIYPGFPPFMLDPNTTDTGTSMHAFTHWEPDEQPSVQTCVTYAMGKLALMLERMRDTREGDGNLLDNTALLAFSECTEGRTHNATEQPGIPIIIAGRAGGNLVHPGIHYASPREGDEPGEDRGRNVSCVPLTLMQALDTGITSWGNDDGRSTHAIEELLA